jgi:hypothetical protein
MIYAHDVVDNLKEAIAEGAGDLADRCVIEITRLRADLAACKGSVTAIAIRDLQAALAEAERERDEARANQIALLQSALVPIGVDQYQGALEIIEEQGEKLERAEADLAACKGSVTAIAIRDLQSDLTSAERRIIEQSERAENAEANLAAVREVMVEISALGDVRCDEAPTMARAVLERAAAPQNAK